MSDLGLQFRLSRGLDQTRDEVVYATVHQLAIGDPVDLARRDVLAEITEEKLGYLAPEVLVEARTERMNLSFVGFEEEAPDQPVVVSQGELVRQPWGAFLLWPSGFEDHVDVVEGRLPGPAGDQLEVVLPDGFQRHAAIGDIVQLDLRGHDDCQAIPGSDDPTVARDEVRCRPTLFTSSKLFATIVGFVAPTTKTTSDGSGTARPRPRRLDRPQCTTPSPHGERRARPRRRDGPAHCRSDSRPWQHATHHHRDTVLRVFGRDLPEVEARHRIGLTPDLDVIGIADVSAPSMTSAAGKRTSLTVSTCSPPPRPNSPANLAPSATRRASPRCPSS